MGILRFSTTPVLDSIFLLHSKDQTEAVRDCIKTELQRWIHNAVLTAICFKEYSYFNERKFFLFFRKDISEYVGSCIQKEAWLVLMLPPAEEDLSFVNIIIHIFFIPHRSRSASFLACFQYCTMKGHRTHFSITCCRVQLTRRHFFIQLLKIVHNPYFLLWHSYKWSTFHWHCDFFTLLLQNWREMCTTMFCALQWKYTFIT